MTARLEGRGGGGQPLPDGVRSSFERSLTADLGAVRVHTDDAAAEAAGAFGAAAVTVGQDISFGAGRFQPDDPYGLHLLAHEVAHTQQQVGADPAVQPRLETTAPGDHAEREAEAAADAMVAGATARVGRLGPAIARASAETPGTAGATGDTAAAMSMFVKEFKREFQDILGEGFGGDAALTSDVVAGLFTPAQRKLLSGFFASHVLPDGLFTGAAGKGGASTKQRTLMSAHMLSHGKHLHQELGPEHGMEEKPHAQFCGHWALWVWQYAGVMPAEGMGSPGTLESVGPTGQTSFGGGGKLEKGDISLISACGPSERRKPLGDPNPAEMEKIFKPGTLEPGDWIYIDNGKPAGHSEIFAGWADDGVHDALGNDDTLKVSTVKPIKVRYRKAWVYSQRDNAKTWNPAGGGDRHMETIGFPYAQGYHPVTAIFRPDAKSGPPDTPEKFLPFKRDAATAANLVTIGKDLDFDKLRLALWVEADCLLSTSKQLQSFEPSQRALVDRILGECVAPTIDSITTLVALVQKLRLGSVDGVLSKSVLPTETWPRREKITATGKLDFAYDIAIERNRHNARVAKLDPAKLAPLVAKVVGARPAANKATFEKAKAKEPAHFATDKDRFDELFEMYASGTDLKALSILIALWQFLKDKPVDGWVAQYGTILDKAALVSAAVTTS